MDDGAAGVRQRLQTTLGNAYSLESELGGGGMSRVFSATETALGRKVVVKVLPPEMSQAMNADRFRREIRLSALLQHPAIVPLLNAGEGDGLLYYTMPFVEGESLRQRLARGGELAIVEAVRVLREIARALVYAHARGVVHRDVKPENVLLGEDAVLVADFGVAKALSAAASEASSATSTGVALGTPAYMAPEQIVADPHLDHRADLYALGIVAYEVLTGVHPFAGRPITAILAAHATERPESILKRRPGLPSDLAVLVMQLLEKRPSDRPQSAQEVLQELEAVANRIETRTRSRRPPLAKRRGARPWIGVIAGIGVLLSALAGYTLLTRQRGQRTGSAGAVTEASGTRPMPPGRAASVGVLPFVNIGGDTATEYFADGMTDELIGALSKVRGLRVPGRTSVFTLKGRNLDARTIGDTLQVTALVEGSVRRSGSTIRVAAKLVSADDNGVLWSDTYERELRDVFRVQDEIVRAIVGALQTQLKLNAEDNAAVVRSATGDVEAHDLYLKGRFLWNQRTYEPLRNAVRYFERAIARDSTYAQAYAGLADAYLVLPFFGPARPTDVFPKAKRAAERALSLDSSLAEAHASLAYVRMLSAFDWAGAEAEFRRAIATNTNYANTHHWYAHHLIATGRREEAIAQTQRARALDPLSRIILSDAALVLLTARRYDDAMRALRATLELDPNFAMAHHLLCRLHLVQGQTREAVAACELAATLSGHVLGAGTRVYAFAAARDRPRAIAALREIEARSRNQYVAPTDFAIAHLGLGDTAAAVAWLDSAVSARDPFLTVDGAGNPLLDPLRSDARFGRLRTRMGLR